MRCAASIWLRMSASSGETSSVGPLPRSRSMRVAMKYTALLPHPVRCTSSTRSRRPTSRSNRLQLVRPELRRRVTGEPPQQPEGLGRKQAIRRAAAISMVS